MPGDTRASARDAPHRHPAASAEMRTDMDGAVIRRESAAEAGSTPSLRLPRPVGRAVAAHRSARNAGRLRPGHLWVIAISCSLTLSKKFVVYTLRARSS